MKTEDLIELARILGVADGLFQLPLMQVLGDGGTSTHSQWMTAYRTRGLPLGRDRAQVSQLRELTTAGLLTTSGATLGKTWKLTQSGVFVAMAALGLPTGNCRDLLQDIIDFQAVSHVANPYQPHGVRGPARLVMAWDLIPTGGVWLMDARKSPKTWGKYQDERASLSNWLTPLLVLNFVHLLHDARGIIWAVRVTDEGRAAIHNWPKHPDGFKGWNVGHPECDKCFEGWLSGFDEALSRYATTPAPAEFHSVVACRLPQSAWWTIDEDLAAASAAAEAKRTSRKSRQKRNG